MADSGDCSPFSPEFQPSRCGDPLYRRSQEKGHRGLPANPRTMRSRQPPLSSKRSWMPGTNIFWRWLGNGSSKRRRLRRNGMRAILADINVEGILTNLHFIWLSESWRELWFSLDLYIDDFKTQGSHRRPSASHRRVIQCPALPSDTHPIQRAFLLTGCRPFP